MDSRWNWIKSTACFLSVLGLPAAGWADSANKGKDKKECECTHDGCSGCSITPACGCNTRGHAPFFTVDFIYWQAAEDQINYAIKTKTKTSSDENEVKTSERIEQPHFRFRPGFKVGLGYLLPCDGWDVFLNWTWLHAHKKTETGDGVNSITPAFTTGVTPTAIASEADVKFRFKYNTVDLELGRAMFLSRRLSLRPDIGIRGVSIDQDIIMRYSTLSDPFEVTRAKQESDFFGLGPRVGLGARYGTRWAAYGSLHAALMYGKRDISSTTFNVDSDGALHRIHKSADKHRVRPNLELALGFDWGTCYSKGYYVNLGLAYEAQYWWAQFEAPSTLNQFPQGDLILHGLTAHARFDF